MEVIQGCRRASSALVGEKMYGDDGMAKLWLTQKTLGFRAAHQKHFEGDYEPIFAKGENTDYIAAFVRNGKAITVVPRFTRSKKGAMPTLVLPKGSWRNEFTGEIFKGEVSTENLLKKFPVALLVQE